MKARQKKIEQIEISSMNLNIDPRLKVIEVNDPPARKSGIMVKDIDELVQKLKNEAKVI